MAPFRATPLWLIITLALAACGAAPATVAPTVEPPTFAPLTATPPATFTPEPVPTWTAVPPGVSTVTPSAAPPAVLPAPLLVLAEGVLARVKIDGTTTRPFAREGSETLLGFDNAAGYHATLLAVPEGVNLEVGASDMVSVYLLGPGLAMSPRFTTDGMKLAARLELAGQTPGVYLLPTLSGGPQTLLQADNPPPEPAQPALLPGLVFEPLEWSPDSTKLLLSTAIPDADYCGMAVKDVASGALAVLDPAGALTDCDEATWSEDGTSILLPLQDAGASAARLPGLFRADPLTGAVTPLLPETLDGEPALYSGARQLANGDILAFVARVPGYDPAAYPPQPALFNMVRFPAGQQQPVALRQDADQLFEVLWAPDMSGAVVLAPSGGEDPDATALFWLPADGGDAVRLPVRAPEAFWWDMVLPWPGQ